MPQGWLDQVSVEDVLVALAAVVAVVGGIWLVVKFVHPVMVKVVQVLDLILGRPDQQGIPGKPSMMQRFDRIDGRLTGQDKVIAEIKAEVTPNHGGSAHDAITKRIDGVDEKVGTLGKDVGTLGGKVDSILTALKANGITPT